MSARYVIVNADDLGASRGINRAIADCHVNGVVTSASFMVKRDAATDAVGVASAHPKLSIGLHFDDRGVDLKDVRAVRDELARQLELFRTLLDRDPTHLDSHHHAHRSELLWPLFVETARPLGIPVRQDGRVRYVGGFFAQWEVGVVDLAHVSSAFLEWILRTEVTAGWTEIGCHPGYASPDLRSRYTALEREAEVQALTDSRIRDVVDELGLTLASFADFNATRSRENHQTAAAAGTG